MRAVAVCGSWAADRATAASDVDLVVVLAEPADRPVLAANPGWVVAALGGDGELVRRRAWGPWMTEVRLRRASGLEVEVGLVDPVWASVTPVDPGTASVVADGFDVRYDPHGVLVALVEAVASGPPRRVQVQRSKGWRKPAGTVVVARPSRWGNPFRVGVDGDRRECVGRYRAALLGGSLPYTPADVRRQLAGHHLACWCPPGEPCHADVLLAVANPSGPGSRMERPR